MGGARALQFGYAELVAGMGCQGVVRHQLLGHLGGEQRLQAAGDVDACQLRVFLSRVGRELMPLARQVGLLSVGLRADGDVLASGHRHRPGAAPRNTFDQDRAAIHRRRGDADEQAPDTMPSLAP